MILGLPAENALLFFFTFLFSNLKLWIVGFKRSDEVFEIVAFNLAGVEKIEILFALEIQELSYFLAHFWSFLIITWQRSGQE